MSPAAREAARAKAKERYARDPSQARRCYLRALLRGEIRRPRPDTLAKWGIVVPGDENIVPPVL